MSWITCQGCGSSINSDDDPDCFVEIGNMRRLHQTAVLCDRCRQRRQDEEDRDEPCDAPDKIAPPIGTDDPCPF